ncbi:two-component system chemotaxis sensor kinase CheA [Paenibacillus endophyticus]|uniref:Circadian input-output histidine kinase CikA n=1 Tax=Paenibacillus endophyticus TaxID=1294268 RepID=A0A7W5G8E4_9BACL|nr:response regulator [Paenibacillus endophyticus]MBB3150999.1 two-component system chemotaxis sensor kinase CheA [Paenibacillus endophyticus]
MRNLRINIKWKILIGYFLIICCVGTSILVVSNRISSLQLEIETITSRDIEIHNLITTLRYNAVSMETSQRGFVITGTEIYLEPYTRGKAEWEANYNTLYQYLSDDPSSRKSLEEIKITIQNWISEAGEPTIAMRKANNTQGIIDFFNEDTGKQQVDDLRTQLETLRQKEITSTRDHILDLKNRNDMLIISLYLMLIIVSIISFIIVSYVSGTIVKTIKDVVKTISEIASSSGDLSTRIKVNTRDEIKDLAEATNHLLSNLNDQYWIQEKVAEVATMNQGINDIPTLAKSFLTKLAPMLDAAYGVFYIRTGTGDQQRLVKSASYAAFGDEAGHASFRLGEGLIGQAALEKRTFLLNAAPDHKVSLQTGLGKLEPKSILIIPFEFEGKVEAIVEFASVESFTSQHLKLLEQLESHFGVAINNVQGRMEVERLLSESQVLTEELQTQTEELQTQSEELQMQQEEMRMTTEHLEEQNLFAEQKTKELEKAKEELETYSEQLRRSSQYKSNFLANMSHELRTPLNSILILSQMLAENENNTLNSDEAGYAKVIHTSGNDLLALIDDILDLSKVEAGKMILTMDEVNISEIPEHMHLLFNPVADNKNLSFDIHVDANVPPVLYTDGQRLQQILKNLLSNAIKFTETGSVAMNIQNADPKDIQKYIPDQIDKHVLAISVSDTGIGIPLDKQQLIFEAFQQVDGETNRQYGGTGLGLSICNEFTKLLRGRIILDSTPDKGSVFTLFVPSLPDMEKEQLVARNQEVAAAVETKLEPPAVVSAPDIVDYTVSESTEYEGQLFKDKKILLVEDDSRNIFALVKALENKGMNVTVANNGKQCLEVMSKQTDFDLILMDIMMPIMDGYETMKAIRLDSAIKYTPIIALTAKAMKSDRDKCLEAGASDYISKPLNMDQLFSLMRVWLTKQVEH